MKFNPPSTPFNPLSYPHDGTLQDPYGNHTGDTARLSADIPMEEYLYFKRIFPFHGVLQATINTIIYGIIDELKNNNIQFYTPSARDLIIESVKRRAFIHYADQAATRDDGRGVSGVSTGVSESQEASNSHSQTCQRRPENEHSE